MWVDESLSLLIAVARVVPDLKLPQELAVMCLEMANDDQEQAKFFILAQEILLRDSVDVSS